MERVVTGCHSSPAQWTNVTNTFAALIRFELHNSAACLTSNSNSYSTSNVAGFDAARILYTDACVTFIVSYEQYCALHEGDKAGGRLTETK